jgi:transketolase
MHAPWTDLDARSVAVARGLAMDAVQKANSGHPGTPMALSPVAHLLFQQVLRHDPADPHWLGRDRFILSCGHASMLLYSQLYLTGYGLELSDLENFRQWNSLTPGHPEVHHTAGVEMTTGPLGQGISTSVGLALGQRYLRGLLDPSAAPGTSPFDNEVWVIVSDGDLQEGVSGEASSLAGTQQLGHLNVIWDDNHISIDGNTALSFTEDVAARYAAYGWHTIDVEMAGNGDVDVESLLAAMALARTQTDRPTLIKLHTTIGWSAPTKAGTAAAHGAPLGPDEIRGAKVTLGLDPELSFQAPDEVLAYTREAVARGKAERAEWEADYPAWREREPERAALLDRLVAAELPAGWDVGLDTFEVGKSLGTRKSSEAVMNLLVDRLPEIWGGSADLAESNGVVLKSAAASLPTDSIIAGSSPYGRYVHFGIREMAMVAATNGASLTGLLKPFGATFLTFSDYARGAIRLAAIMQTNIVTIFSHDSIGVGEDGPTHQPIEHHWALRAIPNYTVVRPAEASEVAAAWVEIIKRGKPTALITSRQGVPTFDRTVLASTEGVAKGGYVLSEATNAAGVPDVIIIATGTEVEIGLEGAELLRAEGIAARLVSMPSTEWFDEQSDEYRESVLPAAVRARVSVEAGATFGWWRYLGTHGRPVGLDHFGASAPAPTLYEKFNITAPAVAAAAKESIAAAK